MNNSPVKIWRNQKHVREVLGKTGKIVSFTIIRIPPQGFSSQAPYPVVLVDIGHALSSQIGQLVDYDKSQLKMGQKVQAVLRRVKVTNHEDLISYGVKFKPA